MREILIRAGRVAFEHGLLFGASGNLSARQGEKLFITRSGSYLGFLQEADIIEFPLESAPPAGSSMETRLHLHCYLARPEIGAVLHSQPASATILAAANLPLNLNYVPETMYYLRNPGRVPYAHPGSPELAELVGRAALEHDLVIMENHGLAALGKDVNDVLLKTISFEFLARAVLTARAAGVEIKYLPEATRADLRAFVDRMKKV